MGHRWSADHSLRNTNLDFLENEVPALLEEVSLVTRMGMFFQHDGVPAHSSRKVIRHLNLTFPGRWNRQIWSRCLATKVAGPYTIRCLTVGMFER